MAASPRQCVMRISVTSDLKIAYSAFYMTRLEWVLRKCRIEKLYVAGIVTNGGVASTVRDAHIRDVRSEDRLFGVLHDPAGMGAAQVPHRKALRRRHRHQWRRRLDSA